MAAMDLHTYDNTLYEKVYQTAYQAAAELIETAGMKAGQILVVGCSTSEVGGEKIGTYSSPELAAKVFGGIYAAVQEKGIYLADTFGSKKEAELAAAYEESRKTSLFQVSDACVGCGTCAAQCPIQAITLQDGRPVWSKESCLLCLGCVHKCPKNAIAYTQATIGHGQYVNPHISSVV